MVSRNESSGFSPGQSHTASVHGNRQHLVFVRQSALSQELLLHYRLSTFYTLYANSVRFCTHATVRLASCWSPSQLGTIIKIRCKPPAYFTRFTNLPMNMFYSVKQLVLRSKYISIYFCFSQIELRRLHEQFSQSHRLIQQQIRMSKVDNVCTTGWKQHRNSPGDLNSRSEPDEAVTTWSKNKECSSTTFDPRTWKNSVFFCSTI